LCTEPCSCGDSRIRRPLCMPMVYNVYILARRILKSCKVRSTDKGLNETKITPQGRYPRKHAFVYKIVNTYVYIPCMIHQCFRPPHPAATHRTPSQSSGNAKSEVYTRFQQWYIYIIIHFTRILIFRQI